MTFKSSKTLKVWDPLIRIFHWSLVFFFFLSYFTEDDWMTIHSYAGYSVILLILFRVAWGFIGTGHARFSDFIPGINNIIGYLKELMRGNAKRYVGHNPAGSVMILILLTSLLVTTLTGMSLFATEGGGPFTNTFISTWSSDLFEEVHEFFANFTLLMIIIHVGGVILSSLIHRENLVISMINGRKEQNLDITVSHIDNNCQGEQP